MQNPQREARGACPSQESWQLREAKARFSAVVNAAMAGRPQYVTRRGEPVVVVIAAEDYERMRRLEKPKPPPFSEYLLDMPADDGEFDRLGRDPDP